MTPFEYDCPKCGHGHLAVGAFCDACGAEMESLRIIGLGGGPIRASVFPRDAAAKKRFPVATGVCDYFPDALAVIAEVSLAANEQHNPGTPVHWDRSKSADEADALMRHFLQRGTRDDDGLRHTAKMAWRALALLQKEIEAESTP